MLHNYVGAALLYVVVKLPGHFSRGRALLLRVGKAAQPLKVYFLCKLSQLLKLLLALSREARNKGGAENNVRDFVADLIEQCGKALSVAAAVHFPEDLAVAVLQGQVNVFYYFILARHYVDKLVRNAVGVAVEHAYPVQPVDFAKLGEQPVKRGLSV